MRRAEPDARRDDGLAGAEVAAALAARSRPRAPPPARRRRRRAPRRPRSARPRRPRPERRRRSRSPSPRPRRARAPPAVPAAIRATTGSVAGASPARSAKPSIAEAGNGGRSTAAARRLGEHAPGGLVERHVLGLERLHAVEHERRAPRRSSAGSFAALTLRRTPAQVCVRAGAGWSRGRHVRGRGRRGRRGRRRVRRDGEVAPVALAGTARRPGRRSGVRNCRAGRPFSAALHVEVPDRHRERRAGDRLAVHVEHRDLAARVAHPDDGREVARVAVEPGVGVIGRSCRSCRRSDGSPSAEPAPVP